MKLILIGMGLAAFVVSALLSFLVADLPSTTPPEPATHPGPATATSAAPEPAATTRETASIEVRGTTIRVGDPAAKAFNTLKPADLKQLDFTPDPPHPEGLLVTRQYHIDGHSFSLTIGRDHLLGPERIVRISTASPQIQGQRLTGAPSRPPTRHDQPLRSTR